MTMMEVAQTYLAPKPKALFLYLVKELEKEKDTIIRTLYMEGFNQRNAKEIFNKCFNWSLCEATALRKYDSFGVGFGAFISALYSVSYNEEEMTVENILKYLPSSHWIAIALKVNENKSFPPPYGPLFDIIRSGAYLSKDKKKLLVAARMRSGM